MRRSAELIADEAFPAAFPVRMRRVPVLKLVLFSFALLAIGYFASPYVVLYRLASSVRGGNCATLIAAIDWPKMRDAMRQSVENGIAGETVEKPNDDDLPPFGSGMLTGMADRVVTQEVTPGRLSTTLAAFNMAGPARSIGGVSIEDARFAGLTRFRVALRLAPGDARDKLLKVWLSFERGRWRITGADMPPALLATLESSAS